MRGVTWWFARPPWLIAKGSNTGLQRDPGSPKSLIYGSAEPEGIGNRGDYTVVLGDSRGTLCRFTDLADDWWMMRDDPCAADGGVPQGSIEMSGGGWGRRGVRRG